MEYKIMNIKIDAMEKIEQYCYHMGVTSKMKIMNIIFDNIIENQDEIKMLPPKKEEKMTTIRVDKHRMEEANGIVKEKGYPSLQQFIDAALNNEVDFMVLPVVFPEHQRSKVLQCSTLKEFKEKYPHLLIATGKKEIEQYIKKQIDENHSFNIEEVKIAFFDNEYILYYQ